MRLNIAIENDNKECYSKVSKLLYESGLYDIFHDVKQKPYCSVETLVNKSIRTKGVLSGMINGDYVLRRYPIRPQTIELLIVDREIFDPSVFGCSNEDSVVSGMAGHNKAIVEYDVLPEFDGDIIHELSHAVGLDECADLSCVMHPENETTKYCDPCATQVLSKARKVAPLIRN